MEKNELSNKKKISPDKLAKLCMQTADDGKADNIIELKVTELSVMADFFVICTGNSEPHIRAISNRICRNAKEELQISPRAIEGSPSSKWILVDFVTVVVHIMTPEMRELYQLDNLWGDAPKLEEIERLGKIANTTETDKQK